MVLSGCKGNTFFWKSTFFYGLICIQSEKIQKTAWFNQLTDSINEGSETEKTSVFCSKKEQNSRIFLPQNKLKRMQLLNIFQGLRDYNRENMYLCSHEPGSKDMIE